MVLGDYMQDIDYILYRLSLSKFRSKFHLNNKMKEYIKEKSLKTIEKHAHDFINKNLAPAIIENDGKQTPMKNHPVFIAQHATSCCCRGCLEKWHHIKKGKELNSLEKEYILNLIMKWIEKEMEEDGKNE